MNSSRSAPIYVVTADCAGVGRRVVAVYDSLDKAVACAQKIHDMNSQLIEMPIMNRDPDSFDFPEPVTEYDYE